MTASVIQGLFIAFLIVDFGMASLHDSSTALVKVSKNESEHKQKSPFQGWDIPQQPWTLSLSLSPTFA